MKLFYMDIGVVHFNESHSYRSGFIKVCKIIKTY